MKHTIITLESAKRIEPDEPVTVIARPQVGTVRPYRLRIDPTIAPFFEILDVRAGMCSAFPQAQTVPASTFMHGAGADLDVDPVLVGMDFSMIVQNISRRVPVPGGRGVPLPFMATWHALIEPRLFPPRGFTADELATATRDGWTPPEVEARQPSAVARVRHVVTDRKHEHPGFGWDPFGGDD